MVSKTISWRELSGEKKWKGVSEHPLNPELGKYLTHYYKMIEPIVNSFDQDKKSETLGLPLISEEYLLSESGLSNDYKVEKYLYASTKNIRPENDTGLAGPKSGYSNWMGYVAVSTEEGSMKFGRRDIVIALRGTLKDEEWFPKYGMQELVPACKVFEHDDTINPRLQNGRYMYYITEDDHPSGFNSTSFRDQVLSAVKELVNNYKMEEISITITGFSMGGAFATIIAADIVYNRYHKPIGWESKVVPVTAFVFANAPVGDKDFKKLVSELELCNLHILRVKHEVDENPNSPTEEKGYFHVGKELIIKQGVHNMKTYLSSIRDSQPKPELNICPNKKPRYQ